jgi:AraC family transcriptional regulator
MTDRQLVYDVGLVRQPPGLCEPPPAADHGLSINAGSPVWATCRQTRRPQRHFRSPGGINLVPAGSESRWVIDRPLTLLKVRFPQRLVSWAAEDLDLDVRTCELQTAIQVRHAQLEHIVRALQAEAEAGNPNGALFQQSTSHALAVLLVRNFTRAVPKIRVREGRLDPAQFKRIIEYIEANLGRDDLSLNHLANVAGTSVSHFKAAFRCSAGVPVHRFVVRQRVERAAALLAAGRSISEAAFEAGFTHPTHMARWTRRLLGITPADLRRRKR